MTLSFDILAGNNANWGFDAFSFAPELSAMPATQPAVTDHLWAAATVAPLPTSTAAAGMPSHQPIATNAASENEENVSPMKNDALCVNLLASDPAARAYDSNLYVASLPDWFTDADLYDLFQRFGPILSAKVMCHKGTHHCKGYGFVLFQRTDDAAVARAEMIGHVVGGNKIQVRRARTAASAPLSDCGPAASTNATAATTAAAMPMSLDATASAGALNVSPHFLSTAAAAASATPQPFPSLYSPAPAFVVRGNNNSSSNGMNSLKPSMAPPQTMFVAIPNGHGVVQGADNVVYMVLTSPQMPSSNVIF